MSTRISPILRGSKRFPTAIFNPLTDLAIAVSESTRRFCIDGRKLSPERVKLVYLGAPLEEFTPRSAEDEDGRPATDSVSTIRRKRLIGTVTRLHESKGNRYLVDAAAIVARERPKVRFVFVGEGPLQPDFEAQAEKLGIRR